MLLKEYWSDWPPSTTIGDADNAGKITIPPKAALGDVVLKIKSRSAGELEIRLRQSKSVEYTVLIQVPPSVQEKIIFDIVQKKNITLREVGELDIF